MANNDFPLIDGIVPSWSDIGIKITPKGAPVIDSKDIKAIKRTRDGEIGDQLGASGGRVMARTTGKSRPGLTITFYRSGLSQLFEALAPIALKRGNQARIGLIPLFIQVQHTPFGSSRIYEWRAKGVRLMGDSMDASEGTEADTVEVTCNPLEIVDMINGVEVLYL